MHPARAYCPAQVIISHACSVLLSDMLVDSFVQDVTNCMDKRQNTR